MIEPASTMKAVGLMQFGEPDVLHLMELPLPEHGKAKSGFASALPLSTRLMSGSVADRRLSPTPRHPMSPAWKRWARSIRSAKTLPLNYVSVIASSRLRWSPEHMVLTPNISPSLPNRLFEHRLTAPMPRRPYCR